jgi:hypothetical protein
MKVQCEGCIEKTSGPWLAQYFLAVDPHRSGPFRHRGQSDQEMASPLE